MIFKKLSKITLTLALATLIGFTLVPQSVARAATSTPVCDGTFLSLPSWHKYLPKDSATCEIKLNFYDPNMPDDSMNKLWLIGAAVSEILTRIGGLIAVVWIIKSGFEMTISNGNPDAIKTVRQKIIYAGVGLAIIILAQTVVGLVASRITGSETVSSGNINFLVPKVNVNNLVLDTIKTAFGMIGAVSVLMVVIGGIKMVFTQGEPANFLKARNTVIYAIAGVVVSLSAYSIVGLIVSRL